MILDKTDCGATYHKLIERLDVGSFNQDSEYNYLSNDRRILSFKLES